MTETLSKNPFAKMTFKEKFNKYMQDCSNDINTFAHCSNGEKKRLADIDMNDVEFIGGLWRVQDKFEHPITMVRGTEFVLGDAIKSKKPGVIQYSAARIWINCYGRNNELSFDYTVLNYRDYWAYGRKFNEVYAELAEKVFAENIVLIGRMLEKQNTL